MFPAIAAGYPSGERYKLQGPYQWPCVGPCQWHSFHSKGVVGGLLIHFHPQWLQKALLPAARWGKGPPEIFTLQLHREPFSNSKGESPCPWGFRERPSKESDGIMAAPAPASTESSH